MLFNFLKLVALLTDVMQELHSLVIFSGDFYASLLEAPLQALQVHTSKLNQGWCYRSNQNYKLKVSRTEMHPYVKKIQLRLTLHSVI